MKLLIIYPEKINVYYFNKQDADTIMARAHTAGKQWAQNLVGFFISVNMESPYVAINVKESDGTIESMEYRDIETNQPEFAIHHDFLNDLSAKEPNAEISLEKFGPILTEILTAPVKARRWEVYPAVNEQFQLSH